MLASSQAIRWSVLRAMTPAINLLRKSGVPHQVHSYQHDPQASSYGLEAAEKMGLPPEQVFKTLVVSLDGRQLAVAVLPVSERLNLKQVARALGAKKAEMADQAEVEKSTGYILGGISPLGQKKRLPTVIDVSAQSFEQVYVSAGRRGLEISLAPDRLQALTHAQFSRVTGKEHL